MRTKKVKPISDGFHTLTPYLVVRGADRAIEFYRRAFGAEELARTPGPAGQGILHAELKIGDSRLLLSDEFPGMGCRAPQSLGGSCITIHLYVEDVDAVFTRAVEAGAQVRMPLADMFWGDRYGKLVDRFGHEWSLATRKEHLTPEQTRERARALFSQGPPKPS